MRTKLPEALIKSGVFGSYDPEDLIRYLLRFKSPRESDTEYMRRRKQRYNPSLFREWRMGTRPDVDTIKEIWWYTRHDGCQFSTLMRIAHGVDCREPEVAKFYDTAKKNA